MRAGNYGEALLRVVERLRAELPRVRPEATAARSTLGEGGTTMAILSADQERLVSELREGLARIATALSAESANPNLRAVGAALDSTEMVTRGTLLSDDEAELPRLLPSFVFLVTLPVAEQDRALELSRRTSQLIAEELPHPDEGRR